MKYRDIVEIVFGGLGCVLFPIILIFGALAYIFIGTMIWVAFGLAIKYWYLTITGVVLLLVGYYYYIKITERYNERKQEKASELERQKTCELCKKHLELEKPYRHKVFGLDDFSKKELKWHKYGKAIIIQNNEKGFCVEIFNILQKLSTSSGFHSINSYTIPIFDVDCKFSINSLVDLKGSEIVCIFTEDMKRHIYINPKLFSNEESGALLKYEQLYPTDAKKDFPFKVDIMNAKELLDQSDEIKLEKNNGKWGLKCVKLEGEVTKFIPLLHNLQIESLPTPKWELANKQAKLYLYHFGAYEKNEKYVPNNIFADHTQPAFVWKETNKIYLDSEIIFDVKLDLAFTVVEFVSLCDGKRTTVNIIDSQYSIKGTVVKTIEFPSFDGIFAPIYQEYLAKMLALAQKCDECIKKCGLVAENNMNSNNRTALIDYESNGFKSERRHDYQEMKTMLNKPQIRTKDNLPKEHKNNDQDIVIKLLFGNNLVLAPPGCGKTRVLAERVMNAIDNGIKVEDMLCLTFTNRAAREMKERIDNRIGNEVVDNLFVGNVHHFCSTMLRENKVIVQKTTIIDDEEKSVIIRDIIRHCLGLDLVNVEEYYNFQHLLHQVEHHHPEDIIVRPELKRHFEDANFMRIAREYTSYKKKYDLLDFEDLLLYGYDYLIEHKNEVKRYSWIQVDEVQDLNRLQLAIIELVTAPNNPCVVYLGDEQQAIYSFMGAKLSTLSYLKDQCQGNIHHFHGNYRSPKYLLDIFNQYAEFNLHVDKDILPQAQGENADLQQPKDALLMESCELREGFYEYDFCAYDMAVERALSYSDGRTAILTYSNKDCDKISERLAHKNIEHFKISGTDFLWTKEVKLIFSHLNVFTQPENIMSWARILMGIGVCQKLEIAHQLISEANKACLRGNDLLDDARRNLIKNFIHDYPHEFVIFDTETTGLDVNNDDIVEIAAIHISNGIVVDELDLMLYTDKTIPLMLGDIENPLPDEYKKREKKDRKEGLLMFLNWVGDTPVLAHNAKYDYQILDANLQRDCRIDDLAKRWIKVHDSLAITRVIEPNLNSYKLKDLLATFNLQGKNSHLAIDDVKATKSLVDYCYKKANHAFILQNEFYANHREIIAKIKEQYGELYRHTESLLSKKAEEGERNLLASETEYAYHYFAERGFIEEFDKMKYLLPFLSEDFIPKEANLSLRQLLDKYMIELNTLRESDLCESKNLKDKVKVYISTVHRAKGLEFENVVVFDVRDGFYPFYEWNNILRDSSDPKERERAKLGIQEDARKLYVAISRAKKRLCIQYPERNTGRSKNGQWFDWPAKPSPFIEKIDFNKKTSITEPSKFGQHDEPSNCDVENRLNSWQTLLEKYKPDWKEVSKRKFKEIECAHISEAVVVPSKYGKSVCFNIIGKGKAFIPLDPIARAEIGDKLNPAEIELVSLKYVGDNPIQAKTDIMRIRIPEKDV